MSDKLSTCCTCGFQWLTGTHGGHSCVSRLLADIEGLKFDLAEAKADLANLVTWQPIDTAPKNGRYILVCDEDGIYIASYQETWIDGRNWRIQIDEGCVMPTHWMPLPDYPR